MKGYNNNPTVKVVMSEQHSLLPEQEMLLNNAFPAYEMAAEYGEEQVGYCWEILPVPADGWNLNQMDEVIRDLKDVDTVVFVSPIPYLLAKLSREHDYVTDSEVLHRDVRLFHNDQREKKELPNGRMISVVAQTGWQLIKI